MTKLGQELTCKRKGNFGLVCGYPLPCPHHTLIIDMTDIPTSQLEQRLIDIKKAIKEGL